MSRCTVGDQNIFRHWRIFGYLRHFHPVFVTGSCRSFVGKTGCQGFKILLHVGAVGIKSLL